MSTAVFVVRIVIAGVLALAAAGKIMDRAGARSAAEAFGVPARMAQPVAILVTATELVAAVLLLFSDTAQWGALAALALLLVFSGAIAASLARGRQPDCHCFGALHSAPAGPTTLARNVVLAAGAGFAAVAGWNDAGPSAFAWLPGGVAVELVAAVAAGALLTLVAWYVSRAHTGYRALQERVATLERTLAARGMGPAPAPVPNPNALPVGTPAPDFVLPNHQGREIGLPAMLQTGRPLILVFSSLGCGPCEALMPQIAEWQRDHCDLTVVMVGRGPVEANAQKAEEFGLNAVLVDADGEIAKAYGTMGTPSAVAVAADGTINSLPAAGGPEIAKLVEQMAGLQLAVRLFAERRNGGGNGAPAAAPPKPEGPPIGEPAPAVSLPDLDGGTVDLADFRGSDTAILFWNPGCGFCQRMLEDLQAWEADPPAGAPRLLLVSRGDVEANRAQELSSPLVLDDSWEVAKSYNANGTPMGILVDAEGNVASELAVGGPAVLELMRPQQADGDFELAVHER